MNFDNQKIVQINNNTVLVCDVLKELLTSDSEVSVYANSFSVYAFEGLKEQLEQVNSFRFLYAKATFTSEADDAYLSNILCDASLNSGLASDRIKLREFYIPKLNRERNLFGCEHEIKLRNEMTQKVLFRQCAQWIERKAKFKTLLSLDGQASGVLIVKNPDETWVFLGINDFNAEYLGLQKKQSNLAFGQSIVFGGCTAYGDDYQYLFDRLWEDRSKCKLVTDAVINKYDDAYSELAPRLLYYQTLNYIFSEFVNELNEDYLPNDNNGFRQSLIWNKLFDYQKDASLAIINKLEKYNGCILADSVGLGKTFTALSVIKYYQNRNFNILVLCPKKLADNWGVYKQNQDNNIFQRDRFNYSVSFHTDLLRKTGKNYDNADLSQYNWSNYDLIVIDESHNFRNGGKKNSANKEQKLNRYDFLLKEALSKGVKTKVLMLSATPVNNRFNDLKHQLEFAYEGNSELINNKLNISTGIDTVFKQAQKAYNAWSKLAPEDRSSEELSKRISPDFFKVLDAFTIARSRKQIERFYSDSRVGKFPERLAPVNYEPATTNLANALSYEELFEYLHSLTLSFYQPSNFLLPVEAYRYIKDNKTQFQIDFTGREQGLTCLMSTNLLKRLESSVYSLELTVSNLLDKHEEMLNKVANFMSSGLSTRADSSFQVSSTDLKSTELLADEYFDDDELDYYAGSNHTAISLAHMDVPSWQRDLEHDVAILRKIKEELHRIGNVYDCKFLKLLDVIEDKCSAPINEGNRKLLIFTAYANTAEYLYTQLTSHFANSKHKLNFGLVTGGSKVKSTLSKKAKSDFNKVLSDFSPISKERKLSEGDGQSEIDILIATDCISEGQNLQDCDCVVNYDIHWNPVRLIQRFGRIDRVGNKNKYIRMINFWPNIALDDYIKLKSKVDQRMKIAVLSSTGDDNILSNEETLESEYRNAQLEKLKECSNIDEADSSFSITDLGLNEFRIDLFSYLNSHKGTDLERMPHGLNALVATPTGQVRAPSNPLANPFGKSIFPSFSAANLAADCNAFATSQIQDFDAITFAATPLANASANYQSELSNSCDSVGSSFINRDNAISALDKGLSNTKDLGALYIGGHTCNHSDSHALSQAQNHDFDNDEHAHKLDYEQKRLKVAQELGIKSGTILILRNRNTRLKDNKKNVLHPFYMLFLDQSGKVICDHSEPKRMLEIMRFLCKDQAKPDLALAEVFKQETNDGCDMSKYSALLKKAIKTIISEKDEQDISSLFSAGESSALPSSFKGLDDFELLGFVVVMS